MRLSNTRKETNYNNFINKLKNQSYEKNCTINFCSLDALR